MEDLFDFLDEKVSEILDVDSSEPKTLECDYCGRKIYGSQLFGEDSNGNVFCSEDCCSNYYGYEERTL